MFFIKNIIWFFASVFIIFSAIYFSIVLKFPQIRVDKMIKYLFKKEDQTSVSSFSTLMLTLGGRIGVGSIAGVAFSIYYGGIGSIFWMWVMAIFGAPTTMAETILGLSFRKKTSYGYAGGPSYYLKYGLSRNTLSKIYAIIILVSYIGGFLSIQTNTITTSFKQFVNINTFAIGLVLTFITAIIIFGGIKTIMNILDKIVPVMTLLYVFLCILVITKDFSNVYSMFLSIIKEAFDLKPFLSGFIPMFIIGLQRGIFSNESGLGTGSISSSTTDSLDLKKQGYIQMFGVYITTLLICTCTAIIVISSDYYKFDFFNINGIELVQQAFVYHFNGFGNVLLFMFIFLFSFSTILTGYYYGLSALKFLKKNVKTNMFKIITLLILFAGCFIKPTILWEIVDILVGMMAIINIYALLKLKDIVKSNTK